MRESDIIWILLIAFISFMTIRIFYGLIKNEKARKAFSPTIKPGDKVHVPVIDNKVNGEVIEVDDETVTVKFTVPKRIVYPGK